MPVYDFREKHYEIINGEKFLYPSENLKHNLINSSLLILLGAYTNANRAGVVFSHLYTYLPDGNLVFPDVMFIDKPEEKLDADDKDEPFRGVPDMVAEIFSRSTMKRDIGVKKDVYERNGVKEYWMIDPWRETIQVYLLRDGKYELDDVYGNYSDKALAQLTDAEQAEVKMEVPVAVLDGFKVKIRNIFGRYFE